MSCKLEVTLPSRLPHMLHVIASNSFYSSSIFWPDCLRQRNTTWQMRGGRVREFTRVTSECWNGAFFFPGCIKAICSGVSYRMPSPRAGASSVSHGSSKCIYISNNALPRCSVSSLSRGLMQWCCAEQEKKKAAGLGCSRKVMMPQIFFLSLSLSLHFRVVTLLLAFYPPFWGAHHTLNSNMCCCSALISSYKLYVNTVCHRSVLLGAASRVGLVV